MIGLAGAHRTGKTTLAKAWADKNEVKFITPDVSKVIRSMGFDCADIKSLNDRLRVQRRLVEECENLFSKQRSIFVTDRTPLDVAAYTLADATQHMTHEQSKELNQIVEDCITISNSSFNSILLVQPGIPFAEEAGKPPMNIAYQEHIHTLIVGLLADNRSTVSFWDIPRDNTIHEDRVSGLSEVYNAVMLEAEYDVQGMTSN